MNHLLPRYLLICAKNDGTVFSFRSEERAFSLENALSKTNQGFSCILIDLKTGEIIPISNALSKD